MAQKPAKTAKPKSGAKVSVFPKAVPHQPPLKAPMTEAEMVARAAIRSAAAIKGARCVDSNFLIGKRVNGGLQDVFTIILQPVQAPDGGTNMRLQLIPFVPPFFIRDTSRPEIGDRHLIEVYDVPDEIADHYLEKLEIAAKAAAAVAPVLGESAPAAAE